MPIGAIDDLAINVDLEPKTEQKRKKSLRDPHYSQREQQSLFDDPHDSDDDAGDHHGALSDNKSSYLS